MRSRIFRDDLLVGSRAIVTGGGTGIGRATALELASLGADVALLGRRPEPLERTRADIAALGRQALAIPTDIRELDAVTSAIDRVLGAWGGIDVLVNNAGGQFVQPAQSLKPKGFAAVVSANLDATFQITQAVATRAMIPQKRGAIVNMVIDMWNGTPGAAHAGAARAGVENLTKSLSMEWAEYGIRVNAVAPGTIDTGGLDGYPSEVKEGLQSVIPIGRFGRPEEIAWMIAYLVSEAGAFITGETVCLDGGAKNWGGVWNVFQRARAKLQ
jgi:citronellol/citronellal dehydrogenase